MLNKILTTKIKTGVIGVLLNWIMGAFKVKLEFIEYYAVQDLDGLIKTPSLGEVDPRRRGDA